MFFTDAVLCVFAVVTAALICCCICFCRNTNCSSPSEPLPPPQAPAGPVYFYDMTQTTIPDDSAPPPYHLATLYPPVNSHQQMNPPHYQEATFVSVDSPMYYPVNMHTNLRLT